MRYPNLPTFLNRRSGVRIPPGLPSFQQLSRPVHTDAPRLWGLLWGPPVLSYVTNTLVNVESFELSKGLLLVLGRRVNVPHRG